MSSTRFMLAFSRLLSGVPAVRDGVEIKTHARQLAILSKENERITISHFQSTSIADPK